MRATGTRHDVIVVGAGPAGCAAATLLASGGLDVALVDKATFPRDKTCGDGLTTLALRELEDLGFDPSPVESWTPVERAVLHSPRDRQVTLPLPDGPGLYAATARRTDLDRALVDHTVRAGAVLRTGGGLEAASMDRSGVRIRISTGEELHGAWLVAADGVWSPTRRALGLDEHRYRGEWHGFRQYLRSSGSDTSALHVWFEPDLLPGYAWSFPLADGWANVGFGIRRGRRLDGKAMAQTWADLLTRPALRAVLGSAPETDGPRRAWPIPARVTSSRLAAGRVLFTGDAARATDLFTGEGIGQALLTGRLAAELLLDAVRHARDPDAVAEAYRRAVLTALAPDHRMARALSRIMTNGHLAESAIAVVGLTDWTRRNVGRWLFEDSPRGIALTPGRWHRGALSGPPAYVAGSEHPTAT